MDPEPPGGLGGFFPSMFADLLKLMRTDAPLQWDLALQLANSVAAENGGDANVDPVQRIALEQLCRLAELHVADVTGLVLSPDGRAIEVLAVSATEWARRTLDGWRPLLEDVARALAPPAVATPGPEATDDLANDEGDLAGLFGQWASVLAPAMTAMQMGSIVGHLAQRSLGTYDLPLPRTGAPALLFVPRNLVAFAADWSIAEPDVQLYFLARDLTLYAVLTRSAVAERVRELLIARASGLKVDAQRLEERLGELGPGALGDLGELSRLLGDPETLRALEDTPELHQIDAQLRAITAMVLGYATFVSDTVAARAIGAGVPVREAARRARAERGDEARGAEAMFGLHLDLETADAGEAFIRGVLERGGERDLTSAWSDPAALPTPAELAAPGLWLERLHLGEVDT